MSGHSKWAQIKRQKGAADVKRGALYTKLGHTIALAVREGGKDATMNGKLRLALEKAKSANMPSSTIDRAIKRGAGELAGGNAIEQVSYEGFGPGGIALIVETVTDNKNRTAAEVRRVLTKYGGSLGASGSVQWMFEPRGVLTVAHNGLREEDELAIIDAGAVDIVQDAENYTIRTKPEDIDKVRVSLQHHGIPAESAEVAFVPKTLWTVPDDPTSKQALRLIEELESIDDVARVTTNAPEN